MSLPYRWHPSGTRPTRDIRPGMLWPFEHEVYRIIEVNPVPESEWSDEERVLISNYRPEWRAQYAPKYFVVRPASVATGDVRDRDHDRHLRLRAGYVTLDIYPDEHYPICAECREPLPCRDQMAERVSGQAIDRMGRYETAGICPACQEPVTGRQQSRTWPDNIEIPHGPPVTFHLRRQCKHSAVDYEKRWVAADPERRRTVLSCAGHVINHNDGTYQCSELTECPGPAARHRSYATCRCPDCHARGPFGCNPLPSARNAALDAGDPS